LKYAVEIYEQMNIVGIGIRLATYYNVLRAEKSNFIGLWSVVPIFLV